MKAILCVHQFGMPCDMARIVDIGRRRGLPVIEDAACAIASEILWNGQWEKNGKPPGDIACFSFQPRKVITTGDGGMLTTANPEYDKNFRLWRQHSMSVPDTVRHGARGDLRVLSQGRVQLPDDGSPSRGRAHTAVQTRRAFKGAAETRGSLQRTPRLGAIHSNACRTVLSQEQLAELLRSTRARTRPAHSYAAPAGSRVSSRRGVMCSHLEPAYHSEPFQTGSGLEISERVHHTGVILPLFSGMADDDVTLVCDEQREVASACGESR